MALHIINSTIVVLAKGFEPSSLHPDILKARHVVPRDWVAQEQTIITAFVSVVGYTNGFVLSLEQEKLQVSDNTPLSETEQSQVPVVAQAILKTLGAGLHPSSVGINFLGFVDDLDSTALDYLMQRFIRDDVWSSKKQRPTAVSVRFQFKVADAVLTVSCETGTMQRSADGKSVEGLAVNANYHTDIQPTSVGTQGARRAIKNFEKRHSHFITTVPTLLGKET